MGQLTKFRSGGVDDVVVDGCGVDDVIVDVVVDCGGVGRSPGP
jgi:hypothetical protein